MDTSTPWDDRRLGELHTTVRAACRGEQVEVRALGHGLRVTCPEADFVVRMSSVGPTVCETDWEVTVREPLPGLSTWWGRWQRSLPAQTGQLGPALAAELGEALARVRGMLDDRARAAASVG